MALHRSASARSIDLATPEQRELYKVAYEQIQHNMELLRAGVSFRIEPRMTLCVESYIGEERGSQGVKLEQQVLITEHGQELLSSFAYEDVLLN